MKILPRLTATIALLSSASLAQVSLEVDTFDAAGQPIDPNHQDTEYVSIRYSIPQNHVLLLMVHPFDADPDAVASQALIQTYPYLAPPVAYQSDELTGSYFEVDPNAPIVTPEVPKARLEGFINKFIKHLRDHGGTTSDHVISSGTVLSPKQSPYTTWTQLNLQDERAAWPVPPTALPFPVAPNPLIHPQPVLPSWVMINVQTGNNPPVPTPCVNVRALVNESVIQVCHASAASSTARSNPLPGIVEFKDFWDENVDGGVALTGVFIDMTFDDPLAETQIGDPGKKPKIKVQRTIKIRRISLKGANSHPEHSSFQAVGVSRCFPFLLLAGIKVHVGLIGGDLPVQFQPGAITCNPEELKIHYLTAFGTVSCSGIKDHPDQMHYDANTVFFNVPPLTSFGGNNPVAAPAYIFHGSTQIPSLYTSPGGATQVAFVKSIGN